MGDLLVVLALLFRVTAYDAGGNDSDISHPVSPSLTVNSKFVIVCHIPSTATTRKTAMVTTTRTFGSEIMKKKMATEIGRERRGEADPTIPPGATLVQEPEPSLLNIPTSVGKFELKKRHILMAIGVTVFALLLNIQSAIPLFVTSICVPLLLVLLRVIRDEGDGQLLTPAATKYVFFHHVLTNDHAINWRLYHFICPNKTNFDRALITRVLTLPPKHRSACIHGRVAFRQHVDQTSAFGNQSHWPQTSVDSSLLSSPQNIIALQAMDSSLDCTKWFAVALPISAGQKQHSETCDSGGCAEFYTTFTVLSITWLRLEFRFNAAVGILVSTQAPHEGNFKRYSDGEAGVWCHGMSVFTLMTATPDTSPTTHLISRSTCSGLGEPFASNPALERQIALTREVGDAFPIACYHLLRTKTTMSANPSQLLLPLHVSEIALPQMEASRGRMTMYPHYGTGACKADIMDTEPFEDRWDGFEFGLIVEGLGNTEQRICFFDICYFNVIANTPSVQ
ncbi:uncharacterized protein LACBIDRAFT_330652 [Laccaria bicolor S238N-H82]|uniref:Predicted protein n=1 Tax=Laccaria bicolor (strain S238N-H82 / ATCC MYA-4686) TaxID=486041 RepID=B0DM11_LACBS|nr:uncharacterized protein LACBIDRAFT_330652 [Laccaria bicolor S238N-H82]EDR04392.1 predicted protein [Laccaria bicolor S238N-H82]|eukprot:XP_001884911.1 predicted protein [Laccaria bicolor S238N-H82]